MVKPQQKQLEQDALFITAFDNAVERVREHVQVLMEQSAAKGVPYSFRFLHGTRAAHAFIWPKLGELTCLLQHRQHNAVQKIAIDNLAVELAGDLVCLLALSSREQSQSIVRPDDLVELPTETHVATATLQMLATGEA